MLGGLALAGILWPLHFLRDRNEADEVCRVYGKDSLRCRRARKKEGRTGLYFVAVPVLIFGAGLVFAIKDLRKAKTLARMVEVEATILSAERTLNGELGKDGSVVKQGYVLELKFTLPDGYPYRAKAEVLVPLGAGEKLKPGTTVTAFVDPTMPDNVEVPDHLLPV